MFCSAEDLHTCQKPGKKCPTRYIGQYWPLWIVILALHLRPVFRKRANLVSKNGMNIDACVAAECQLGAVAQ